MTILDTTFLRSHELYRIGWIGQEVCEARANLHWQEAAGLPQDLQAQLQLQSEFAEKSRAPRGRLVLAFVKKLVKNLQAKIGHKSGGDDACRLAFDKIDRQRSGSHILGWGGRLRLRSCPAEQLQSNAANKPGKQSPTRGTNTCSIVQTHSTQGVAEQGEKFSRRRFTLLPHMPLVLTHDL